MPEGKRTSAVRAEPADQAASSGGVLPRSRRAPLLWVAVGLALGIGGALAVVNLADDGSSDGPVVTRRSPEVERAAAPPVSALDVPDRPVAEGPGTDPQDAVDGFLAAEIASDLQTAWTWLSAPAQEQWPSPAHWIASHADLLGTVTGRSLTAIELGDDDALVTGRISRVPMLDPVAGLTAAVSDFSVEVVRSDDGWTVDARTLAMTAVLPADALVADAAEQFVLDAQACRQPIVPLVGRPSMAEALCDTDGQFVVGEVGPLDDLTILQPFTAAYGGEVTQWARTVALSGALDATLVVGPLGDGWIPIGLARPL